MTKRYVLIIDLDSTERTFCIEITGEITREKIKELICVAIENEHVELVNDGAVYHGDFLIYGNRHENNGYSVCELLPCINEKFKKIEFAGEWFFDEDSNSDIIGFKHPTSDIICSLVIEFVMYDDMDIYFTNSDDMDNKFRCDINHSKASEQKDWKPFAENLLYEFFFGKD